MALQASFFPSSSSSSSSSFSYEWPYDVFLSFRGSDIRYGFTGNLYKALSDKGIHTFFDDPKLQGGEEITPALVKAIQDSRIAIVVFSVNYASSSFCLHELATIMECIKGMGRLVLPVFYDVDPWDVRHQKGSYGEAMARHEERFRDDKERVQQWKEALRQAGNLSGADFKPWGEYEYVFIQNIVKMISKKVSRVPLHIADHPIGLESRVLEVNSLLNYGFDGGVLMVRICGIGGIGKTILARAIYNFIADQFDSSCFLENVREKTIKIGLVHLQETLLFEMLGERDIKLGDVHQGISMIKHRLRKKKVLLVLDDVDELKQLQGIVGACDWFGFGSRVIITTQDTQLLACHGVKIKYEVEGLSEEEALELLRWNAFKDDNIDPTYMDILKHVVTYACGLPLALEVIGSKLSGRSPEEWRYALNKFERIPSRDIQKILEISFDKWRYDVFLSFRGSDTRLGFTGYLYKALSDKGIHTFFDDQEIQGGEEITPALVKAIQDSRIAIVVFSVNYASSSFCLDELAMIMKHVKGNDRLVLPVFYHVDPCEVRHQIGKYGEAMTKHEGRFKDDKEKKVPKWREALHHAANLSGEHFKLGNEYEYVCIEKLVEVISKFK